MRAVLTAAFCLSLIAALPVEAQTRLPRKSPAERQVESINRNLQQEQRLRRLEQQIQTENNQFRQSIDRQRLFSSPPPTVPQARRGTCPPAAIGC